MSAWTQVCPSRPPALVSSCMRFPLQVDARGFRPTGGGVRRLQWGAGRLGKVDALCPWLEGELLAALPLSALACVRPRQRGLLLPLLCSVAQTHPRPFRTLLLL